MKNSRKVNDFKISSVKINSFKILKISKNNQLNSAMLIISNFKNLIIEKIQYITSGASSVTSDIYNLSPKK